MMNHLGTEIIKFRRRVWQTALVLCSLLLFISSINLVYADNAGFVDVYQSTPHYEDIVWMKDSKVSEGWLEADGTRTFRPMNTVVRQDMAAFLRREAILLGVDSASTYQPSEEDWKKFSDVNKDTPHAEDILWMAKEGVTTGYPDGTYGGMIPVYRQDMAAFIHRLYKLSDQNSSNSNNSLSFTDVNQATPHSEDILWMASKGITTGYDNNDGTKRYEGMTSVYRQDMAAFLRRLYAGWQYDKAEQEYAEAEQAYENASKKLTEAQQAQKAKQTEVDAQSETVKKAEAAANKAEADNSTAADVEKAKKDVSAKTTAAANASKALNDAKQAVSSANTASASANQAVTAKTKVVNAKSADTATKKSTADTDAANAAKAKKAYETAAARSNENSTEYKARKAAYDQAAADLAKAVSNKNAAVKAKENADKELTTKQNAQTNAETVLNNANTALSKKNAEIADAQAAVNDAKAKADADSAASTQANNEVADAQVFVDDLVQAKKELEEEKAEAQKTKDAADKAVLDSQAEVNKLSQQLAEKDNSLEYFKTLGDNGKYAIDLLNKAINNPASFTTPSSNPYDIDDTTRTSLAEKGITQINNNLDATSLDNMLKALDYIDKCNEIRKSNGLSELKVSPYLMAAAQVNSNIESASLLLNVPYHYMFSTVTDYGENATWGSDTPEEAYDGWYTQEKATYDYIRDHFCRKADDGEYVDDQGNHIDESTAVENVYNSLTDEQYSQIREVSRNIQIGHYQNVVNEDYQYTGFGLSLRKVIDADGLERTYPTCTQTFMFEYFWQSDDAKSALRNGAMTTDEMRKSILAYEAPYQTLKDDTNNAQLALQKALDDQDSANKNVTFITQVIKTAENNLAARKQTVAEKQANADTLAAAAKQSAQELAEKETALNQMNNASETKAVNDAAAALAKAKTEAAAAKQAVTDAQNKVTAAEANVTSATDARNKAQANLNALKTDLNTAKAAYDAAQTKAAASKKVYEDARADLSNEQSKLDELKKAAEKAKKEADQANAAVTEKTEAYQRAQNAQSSAEKTLKEATASHQKAVDARNKANEESKKLTALQNELTGLNKVVEKASTEYEAARKVKESAADRLAKAKALANK